MKISYVKQRLAHDCGVAALAMAAAVSYERVLRDVDTRVNGEGLGLNESHIREWLFRNGFAYQLIYCWHQLGGTNMRRDVWPAKPWGAPSYIVQLVATQSYHFVAMDKAGRVYDPWDDRRSSLDHPDYREVSFMMGIWPVT